MKILNLTAAAMIGVAASVAGATGAFAASHAVKPAVVYDMGGKFDKSFNEGVYNGIKRFEDETGVKVMEFEVTNEAQREQAMNRMVQRGATIVGPTPAGACNVRPSPASRHKRATESP